MLTGRVTNNELRDALNMLAVKVWTLGTGGVDQTQLRADVSAIADEIIAAATAPLLERIAQLEKAVQDLSKPDETPTEPVPNAPQS